MTKMLYTISIVVLNNHECTRKCLELIEAHTDGEYELIISDNGSTDGTAEFLAEYGSRHPNCRIISYRYNTGFGYPHNQALLLAQGDFFVVVNNDIFIHDSCWLEKLALPFSEDSKLAIVGFAGNNSAFDNDGGTYKDPTKIEYVEASCLMIPRKLAQRYGLFAAEYELAYWEDSDLSLRYRQMGMHVKVVPCLYEHLSNATSAKIDPILLQKVGIRNRKTFVKKWEFYLKRRTFTGRILIKAVTSALDNLLAVTTVLHKLKCDYPLVNFDLITNELDTFQNSQDIANLLLSDQQIDPTTYDRIIDFNFEDVSLDRPVVLELSKQAAVIVDRLAPVLFRDRNIDNNKLPVTAPYVVVAGPITADFDLLSTIREGGYNPIVVEYNADSEYFRTCATGHCSLHELIEIICSSELVIGSELVIIKVAQAFSVPSIAIFNSGDNPFILGIDAVGTHWVFMHEGWKEEVRDILVKGDFPILNRLNHLQASLLRQTENYDALWCLYKELKEQWQHLDQTYLRACEQAVVQEESLKTIIEKYETSITWRATRPIRRGVEFLLAFINKKCH